MTIPYSQFPIHDLYAKSLLERASAGDRRIPILSYSDHLLRRFGYAEHVMLAAGVRCQQRVRPVADEVWALLEGQVEFRWEDLREGSPTRGAHCSLRCDRPTIVLVPFGVAFSVQALEDSAELLRLATHEDPGGREVQPD